MKQLFLYAGAMSVFFFLVGFVVNDQANSSPKVSLQLNPGSNNFTNGATFHYSISVEDKEDGQSKYEEIAANEVFLQLMFLSDSNMLSKYLELCKGDEAALFTMKKNACFSCHSLKQKLIGPSFEAISKKYRNHGAILDYLSISIIKGSKGVWGDTQAMPSHPDISSVDAKAIAGWLVKNSMDPNFDFLQGLEGKFITQTATLPTPKSMFILIPNYLDHGINGQYAAEGRQVLTLAYKN